MDISIFWKYKEVSNIWQVAEYSGVMQGKGTLPHLDAVQLFLYAPSTLYL